MAAEYIVSSGNPNVILCERGIRTFETYTRNTLDLAAVPLLHHLTHLPVIVDPSHATGKRWLVRPLALGGVAVGADGVMVEVHPTPDQALSDAEQQLDLDKFRALMDALVPVHEHVRDLHGDPVAWPAPRRSAAATAWPGIDRDRRRHASRPAAAPARRAAAARRQVDQPPRADARRCWPTARAGSPGRATAPTSARPRPRSSRRSARRVERRPRRRRPERRLRGRRRPGPTGSPSRPARSTAATPARACGSSPAWSPGCRCGSSSTATRRCGAVRWLVSSSRCVGWARWSTVGAERFPPAPHRGRAHPAQGDRLHDAGAVGAGEVGDPAGGPSGRGTNDVRERVATRDHTERMLRARGVRRGRRRRTASGVALTVEGGTAVQAIDEHVPGDISAAAFWLVAAAIHPDAELTLRDVGVNPTRRAIIDLLRSMGADIDERPTSASSGADDGRADRRPRGALLGAGGDRPVSGRRRGGDRRDPGALPRGDAGARDRPRSAARASCATRNRTGSPGSSPASRRSAPGSTSTATTS